jgi:hypothetical protein
MSADFDDSYTRYQSDRSWLRKLVRNAYLASARSQVHGPCLDFGCGVGELLARLPEGSKGVEYNRASVDFCRAKGLAVDWYDGEADDWQMTSLPPDWRFESLVVSHVLEHLEQPMSVLRRLLSAAERRGVRRALIVVPGRAGFRIDATHRTFVDWCMISGAGLETMGWTVQRAKYFPLNIR